MVGGAREEPIVQTTNSGARRSENPGVADEMTRQDDIVCPGGHNQNTMKLYRTT